MYRSRFLGVEITGLHQFISQPIKNEIRVRGLSITYLELNATGDKDTRIARGLEPSYKAGYIYHNAQNCQALENQLKFHPRGKLKDLIDAASYITKICDDEYLFFDPDEDEDEYDEFHDLDLDNSYEDEYEDLEEEWRIA